MNGPAWHDRFPAHCFDGDPDGFPGKDEDCPVFWHLLQADRRPHSFTRSRVTNPTVRPDGGYQVETSKRQHPHRVMLPTAVPVSNPVVPAIVPDVVISQLHSFEYHNPQQLQDGAVMVVGAGSSGAQIADELLRSGRKVYLSIPVRMTGRRGHTAGKTLFGGWGLWENGR